MKFFKENPIFSILIVVLLLVFAGGAWFSYSAYEKSLAHDRKESAAESDLRRTLALNPAPSQANLEAAKANIEALKQSLRQQVETTKGTNPDIIDNDVPASGTELLFQLRGYREQLTRDATQQIPINVNEKSVEEGNVVNPGVKLPTDFAFGFSRYLHHGVPPTSDDVAKVYLQKQILEYVVKQLLETRPIEIRSVQRETLQAETDATAAAPAARRSDRQANQQANQLPTDEFRIGTSSLAIKDMVATTGFRVVFTGYTENLRQFMKALEQFELPLVVRSVAVKPLESGVRTEARGSGRNSNSLDALFGTVAEIDPTNAAQTKQAQEPVVAENISEFTVVIEYITVTLKNAN